MLYISLLLTFIAIFLWKKTVHSKIFSLKIAVIVFSSFFFSGFYYVSDYLTGRGIDESVIYHLSVDLTGAGLEEFSNIIIFSFIYLFIAIVISMAVYKIVLTDYKLKRHKLQIVIAATAMVVAFYVNPGVKDLANLYKAEVASSHIFERPKEYLLPSTNLMSLNNKNIVYLYLESVERTYFDEGLFPGLAPNLRKLEQESLVFTDIRQVYGSGWTIAGMVNSQCGIPLVTQSGGNSMSGTDQFLPEALCLGDILNKSGYNLSYLGGASLDFAGKGNFYKTHGFNQVQGFDELVSTIQDPSYVSNWGLYDNSLLNMVKDRYDVLTSKNESFGLFALTLDTHHPSGHMSEYCKTIEYRDGSNPILNAVHCADKLVYDLVKYIRSGEGYENTIVVISSDHLAMRNTAWEQLQKGDRRNLLMFLGHDVEPKQIKEPGALIDVAPTLLGVLGADIVGLGFGRNLLKSDSLVASKEDINSFLSNYKSLYNNLWAFPQVSSGIEIDYSAMKAFMGQRSISLPALMLLNDSLIVEEVLFEFDAPTKLTEQLSNLSIDQKFIWIDSCKKIQNLNLREEFISYSERSYCVALGALSSKTIKINEVKVWGIGFDWLYFPLSINLNIPFEKIKRNFNGLHFDYNLAELRTKKLRLGTNNIETINLGLENDNLKGELLLKSTGGYNGVSGILDPGTKKIIDSSGTGLTLYGLNVDKTPVLINHLDTCSFPLSKQDNRYSFQTAIEQFSDTFGAFAIVSHNSVVCRNPKDVKTLLARLGVISWKGVVETELAYLFENTKLTEWQNISFRTPYIALILGDDTVYEFGGKKESSVVLEVKNFMQNKSFLKNKSNQRKLHSLPRVAHAGGGGYKGKTYTNSIEALNFNRDKYTLFEIDFSWTSDNHLVCLHDWENSFKNSFGLEPSGKKTLVEFRDLVKKYSDVQKCDLESLTDWLLKNPGARIVTDVKESNIQALYKIAESYPRLKGRFIPQVYKPIEYYEARNLGYKDIIWTLYRYGGSSEDVLKNLKNMDLFALTMPKGRADQFLGRLAFEKTGVLSYAHTINSQEDLEDLRRVGINEIYTDFLDQSQR